MNQVEALHLACIALRAEAFKAKWDHKSTDRYRQAIEMLKRIAALYDPDSVAWKIDA